MIAPYLVFSLVNLFKPENNSQFILIKDHNLIGMKDFLMNGGIPFTLYSNMLTFRDGNKSFISDGDLLETMTKYDFNVSHANPQHQELIYEFGKEMNFDMKQKGQESNRDKSMTKIIKSPSLMVSALAVSEALFLSFHPYELCDRLKVILREKQAGKNSDLIKEEIVDIGDKLLEYKCLSNK